jgi:serine/threonine protein kinase
MAGKPPKVIGQGTYGCVHRPSLKCKKRPNQSYKNKTSKILPKREARIEFSEYEMIKKIDPASEFYLGVPDRCEPNERSKNNQAAFAQCSLSYEQQEVMEDLELFIMSDGGNSLKKYVEEMVNWGKATASTLKKCELFLIDALRLFHGVMVFGENELVHYDIKPDNIVYNEKTKRVNFIDFGTTTTHKKLLYIGKGSISDRNMWFNYPFEKEYFNRSVFYDIGGKNAKGAFDAKMKQISTAGTHDALHTSVFFTNIIDKRCDAAEFVEKTNSWLKEFEKFYTIDMNNPNMTYDTFAKIYVDTVDSYGLAFSLLHWLSIGRHYLKFGGAKHIIVNTLLENLLKRMATPFVSQRLGIVDAIFEFEAILNNSGILRKHHKTIIDHKIVDEGVPVPRKERPVKIKFKRNDKEAARLGEQQPPVLEEKYDNKDIIYWLKHHTGRKWVLYTGMRDNMDSDDIRTFPYYTVSRLLIEKYKSEGVLESEIAFMVVKQSNNLQDQYMKNVEKIDREEQIYKKYRERLAALKDAKKARIEETKNRKRIQKEENAEKKREEREAARSRKANEKLAKKNAEGAEKRKRCPNGTRRNKKTGECEKYSI